MDKVWTTENVNTALDSGDRGELVKLWMHIADAAGKSKALRGWLQTNRTKNDIVSDTLVRLFKDGGKILRRYDSGKNTLKTYVMGVTFNVLREGHRRQLKLMGEEWCNDIPTAPGPDIMQRMLLVWEMLWDTIITGPDESCDYEIACEALVMMDAQRRVEQVRQALRELSAGDKQLYQWIFIDERSKAEICARLGLTEDAHDQRKHRLKLTIAKIIRRKDKGG